MAKTRIVARWLGALLALVAVPALPQSPGGASITLGSGPNKGTYNFAPTQACVIATFGKKPQSISVVLSADDSSLSIDMPSIDPKHAGEIQVVLVVADVLQGQTRKGAASVTYEIDTRPDAVLEPYQKAERANKGTSGKVTTQILMQGNVAMLSFSGETATGVKLTGEVNCQKI